jgi:hypothetical protein
VKGRTCVLSMEFNSAIEGLYGSVSQRVFALPLVRVLPARSPRIRQIFDFVDGSTKAGRSNSLEAHSWFQVCKLRTENSALEGSNDPVGR